MKIVGRGETGERVMEIILFQNARLRRVPLCGTIFQEERARARKCAFQKSCPGPRMNMRFQKSCLAERDGGRARRGGCEQRSGAAVSGVRDCHRKAETTRLAALVRA